MANEIDIYDAKNLNTATVRKFLKGGGQASDDELAMLLAISRNQNMNPFMKEVYFVKYKDSPAQIVVSRDFYRKRAMANPNFAGIEVGVIVQEEDGSIKNLDGAFKTKNQELVGAWARVHLKNHEIPIYVAVSYDEYVQMKDVYENNRKTGRKEPNAMWTAKPCTMLTKVAESQALRMAFPDEFSGTYGEEEYPEQKQPREVNGVKEPSREEIESFNQDKYLEQKKAELESAKQIKETNKETGEILEGEIISKEVTAEDF
ncbi:phage recombination protein Bet [Lactococcus petauri]|uniref:phage recombination protein Bet n=1 Tax=Lactococcus petauri TaxID=1940789 RepID=UPI00254F070D|nr:phage recombination protein Bet [Lactococcus petauri]